MICEVAGGSYTHQTIPFKNMYKLLKHFTKRDIIYFVVCIGLIILQVWVDLKMPDYTKNLTYAISSKVIDKTEILRNGGLMFACAIGSMCAAIATGFFSSHIAADFAFTVRGKLYERVSLFSDAEINRFSTASLITRTGNDVVNMQMFIALGMQSVIKAPILAIWAICKISATNIEWTAAVLIVVGVIMISIGIIVGLCYPKFKKIQTLTDDLNTNMRECITGVRVIRAFNAEKYQEDSFEKINVVVSNNHAFTSRAMGALLPLLTLCMSGLTVAIYWIGAILVNNVSGTNPEEIIIKRVEVITNMTAFTQYSLQVVMAFMLLVAIFILLPRAMVSSRRISEVLDTEPSIKYNEKETNNKITGEIEFKNVTFTYPDGSSPCLKKLNFKIKKGETFAIIGATGSGKSSIVNLIPRFFDVSEGEILLDGINIKDYAKIEIERNISIATQKAILFKGDIKSNVTYGSATEVADDDPRLERALTISQSNFVKTLEKGVHSEVAQGGANFSGGQKQRLSIARAVYKQAKIIIFDDTFSALDYKTDMLVRKEIKEKIIDATIIIVAQRIGTIRNADQILVLDNGEIAGLGKHEELLKNCPVYKEIALSQLKESEL